MNYLQTLILSIVEGITEFLPISSTGHLILTTNLLRITHSEFVKSFEIIIQLGAILAVVIIYFKKIVLSLDFKLYRNILISFLPSVVFGFLFYDLIKKYLIGNNIVVITSLFVGGILMLISEKYLKNKEKKDLTLLDYLKIGLFQVISMIPGVSRSFATILGGRLTGLTREKATEFSFFIAIPTMAAATALDLLKTDLTTWTNEEYKMLAVGFVVSFLTAYISVKWLIKYVQTHDFRIFGWYRIVISFLLSFIL
jgi:undecaprenyl-diphosphatase